VREKYCWLADGWWLVLNWCERKALLAGSSQPNKAIMRRVWARFNAAEGKRQ
jgi:hypothetical protein